MNNLYHVSEHEVSIDLRILYHFIKKRWRYIAYAAALGLLISAFSTLFIERNYKTEAKLLIDLEGERATSHMENSLGALQQLGLDFGNKGQIKDIEQLSQDILYSPSYLLDLLDTPIYFSSLGTHLTLNSFFKKDFPPSAQTDTSGVWLLLNHIDRPEDIYRYKFTPQKISAMQELKQRVQVEKLSDTKATNRLLFSVSLPDPDVSFTLTEIAMKSLIQHIIKQSVVKERRHLEYITTKFQNAKSIYDSVLYEQGRFKEKNAYITAHEILFQKKKIDQDVAFKYRIYSDLGSQYEHAKTVLHQKSPVITILEPIGIPYAKTPSTKYVLLVGVIAGIICGLLCIVIELQIYLFGLEKYLPFRRK